MSDRSIPSRSAVPRPVDGTVPVVGQQQLNTDFLRGLLQSDMVRGPTTTVETASGILASPGGSPRAGALDRFNLRSQLTGVEMFAALVPHPQPPNSRSAVPRLVDSTVRAAGQAAVHENAFRARIRPLTTPAADGSFEAEIVVLSNRAAAPDAVPAGTRFRKSQVATLAPVLFGATLPPARASVLSFMAVERYIAAQKQVSFALSRQVSYLSIPPELPATKPLRNHPGKVPFDDDYRRRFPNILSFGPGMPGLMQEQVRLSLCAQPLSMLAVNVTIEACQVPVRLKYTLLNYAVTDPLKVLAVEDDSIRPRLWVGPEGAPNWLAPGVWTSTLDLSTINAARDFLNRLRDLRKDSLERVMGLLPKKKVRLRVVSDHRNAARSYKVRADVALLYLAAAYDEPEVFALAASVCSLECLSRFRETLAEAMDARLPDRCLLMALSLLASYVCVPSWDPELARDYVPRMCDLAEASLACGARGGTRESVTATLKHLVCLGISSARAGTNQSEAHLIAAFTGVLQGVMLAGGLKYATELLKSDQERVKVACDVIDGIAGIISAGLAVAAVTAPGSGGPPLVALGLKALVKRFIKERDFRGLVESIRGGEELRILNHNLYGESVLPAGIVLHYMGATIHAAGFP